MKNRTADEHKGCGDEALQRGDASLAIKHYTVAIQRDGSNHIYYSNRSAAYLMTGNAQRALEDANSCIQLEPDFAKGYSRKGSALHALALRMYDDSIHAYQQGLEKFPVDQGLKKGLELVEGEKLRMNNSGKSSVKNDMKEAGNNHEEGPSLWKLTGRRIKQYKVGKIALNGIRDGLAVTQKTVQSGLASAMKAISVPDGEIVIYLDGGLKVYNPHDKIKGVIQMNLDKPIQAHSLTVTLEASISGDTKVFDETYEICGEQVNLMNGEFPFEIIVPRLKKDTEQESMISTLLRELSELDEDKGVAKWSLSSSLVAPGESWMNLDSPKYRIHVND